VKAHHLFHLDKGIAMQVNGHLDFKGVGKLIRPGLAATDFPAIPSVGELVLKDGKLYICAAIVDTLPYWVNLVNELSMFRHNQTVAALEWTIVHNLNTNFPLVQVYDASGNQIIPDTINCSAVNQTTVSFNTPFTGVAVLTAGDTYGLPRAGSAYTGEFSNSASWVVTHNLGYNPSITVIVGGYVVQPVSIVHDSNLQATITFSTAQSGSVRCV
jgi:hypothetical protein